MIGWLIVCVILLVLIIVTACLPDDWAELNISLATILSMIMFACIIIRVERVKWVETFQSQTQYVENHVTTNPEEDTALTLKKIELNAELFDAQASLKRLGPFSLYPKEVLDFKPIQ